MSALIYLAALPVLSHRDQRITTVQRAWASNFRVAHISSSSLIPPAVSSWIIPLDRALKTRTETFRGSISDPFVPIVGED